MEDSSWFRLGMAGIEKKDSYTALMGFDGAVVRALQTSSVNQALQLLNKFTTLLLDNSWLHEAKSLIDSFSKGVKRLEDQSLAAEGLFTLGSQIIRESIDLAIYIFDLAAGLDRKNESGQRIRAGKLLLHLSNENEPEQKRLFSEAARNLILARDFTGGSKIYEDLLGDSSSSSLPQLLAYAALGRLVENDIQGAAALINQHRKKKEFVAAIRENERKRAYFEFTVESLSALRSGDAFRYNSIKKAFLQVAGNMDSVMMSYIKEIQGRLPSVPSSLF
ncbi:MAG: hypothetical protein ACXAB4_05400 [Candidatus Hodarchaeales archaeon]|jgi:hypothetical protein